jgi:hypothetical protein
MGDVFFRSPLIGAIEAQAISIVHVSRPKSFERDEITGAFGRWRNCSVQHNYAGRASLDNILRKMRRANGKK